MSLNKFSSEDTGYDLKLNVGADVLKCNTADVLGTLTTATHNNTGTLTTDNLIVTDTGTALTLEAVQTFIIDGTQQPKTTFVKDFVAPPSIIGGTGVLVNNNSIHKAQLVDATTYSTLSGAFSFSSITGGIQGANKQVEMTILALGGISYPADGELIPGAVSCQINDAVTDGLYTTSVTARRNGGTILFDVNSDQDFATTNTDRILTIHYSLCYENTP